MCGKALWLRFGGGFTSATYIVGNSEFQSSKRCSLRIMDARLTWAGGAGRPPRVNKSLRQDILGRNYQIIMHNFLNLFNAYGKGIG
jgi:hypothetical protein